MLRRLNRLRPIVIKLTPCYAPKHQKLKLTLIQSTHLFCPYMTWKWPIIIGISIWIRMAVAGSSVHNRWVLRSWRVLFTFVINWIVRFVQLDLVSIILGLWSNLIWKLVIWSWHMSIGFQSMGMIRVLMEHHKFVQVVFQLLI